MKIRLKNLLPILLFVFITPALAAYAETNPLVFSGIQNAITWSNANAYCASLKTNGYTWILPSDSDFSYSGLTNGVNAPNNPGGSLYLWENATDTYAHISQNLNWGTVTVSDTSTESYVCVENSLIPPTPLITLPTTAVADLTGTASQMFSNIWEIIALFVAVPLGFYLIYRIGKLVKQNAD